jgi:hypothetical protein
MIPMTRRATLLLAASSLLVSLLPATVAKAEPADGTASGTLTVNGKTTPVAYAYAWQEPGFFDKSTMDTHVIVSDVPLDATTALQDPFARGDLADAGKLHAFEITLDASGTPISTAWRHNGFSTPAPSGISTADLFAKEAFDDKIVAGSYKSAAPAEFFGNVSVFDVTFRAAVSH